MRWAHKTQSRARIEVDDTEYLILAEKEDEDFAISINGEYICDTPNLPSEDDLKQIIEYELEVERRVAELI